MIPEPSGLFDGIVSTAMVVVLEWMVRWVENEILEKGK